MFIAGFLESEERNDRPAYNKTKDD